MFRYVRILLASCLLAAASISQASFLGSDWKAPEANPESTESTCD